MSLFDEKGERIRGKESKEAARVALARINVADELNTPAPAPSNEWTVAKVCDVYLADLHRSANPEWAIIPQIDMTGRSRHEELDNSFDPRRMVECLHRC